MSFSSCQFVSLMALPSVPDKKIFFPGFRDRFPHTPDKDPLSYRLRVFPIIVGVKGLHEIDDDCLFGKVSGGPLV